MEQLSKPERQSFKIEETTQLLSDISENKPQDTKEVEFLVSQKKNPDHNNANPNFEGLEDIFSNSYNRYSAALEERKEISSNESTVGDNLQNNPENDAYSNDSQNHHSFSSRQDSSFKWKIFNRNAFSRNLSYHRVAEKITRRALKIYVYLSLLYTLGILVRKEVFDSSYIFGFNAIVCFIQAIRVLYLQSADSVMLKLSRSANWILIAIFTLFAGCRICFEEQFSFSLVQVSIFGLISSVLRNICSATNNDSLLTKTARISIDILFWTQILVISCKIDEIALSWGPALTGVLMLILPVIIISFGIIIYALRVLSRNQTPRQLLYILFGIAFALSHSWIWGYLLTSVFRHHSGQSSSYTLMIGLKAGLLHAFFFVLTILLSSNIISSLLASLLQQNLNIDEELIEDQNSQDDKKAVRFLVKISPSYFMIVAKPDLKKALEFRASVKCKDIPLKGGDGEENCCICYESVPNAVFMNCGHAGICFECAHKARANNGSCSFCRQAIHGIVKLGRIGN